MTYSLSEMPLTCGEVKAIREQFERERVQIENGTFPRDQYPIAMIYAPSRLVKGLLHQLNFRLQVPNDKCTASKILNDKLMGA